MIANLHRDLQDPNYQLEAFLNDFIKMITEDAT